MATVTRPTTTKRKDRQAVDIVGWALVIASVLIVGAIAFAA